MNIVDVIRSLAGFAWIGAIGLFVLAVTRASRNQNAKGISSTAIGVVVVAVILTALGAGLVFIEPNERGVVISPYAFRAPDGYSNKRHYPWLALDRPWRTSGNLQYFTPDLHHVVRVTGRTDRGR